MRSPRRLFRWLFSIAAYSAIGAGVFFLVRSQPRCTFVATHHASVLSEDGAKVLTVDWEVWDTHTGERIRALNWENLAQSFDSKDGRTVAMIRENQPVRLIDWQTGAQWDVPEPSYDSVEFSAKGRWLLVSEEGKFSSLFDVAARKLVKRSKHSMALSADERVLFIYEGPEKHVAVWNLDDGKSIGVLPLKRSDWQASPDGRLLAEMHEDDVDVGVTAINVWDVSNRERRFRHSLPKPNRWTILRFAPSGHRLAVWTEIERRKLWKLELIDTQTGKIVGTVNTPHPPYEEKLSFAPEGTLLFVANRKVALMVDADSGAELWRCHSTWSISYFAQNADIVLRQDEPNKFGNFVDARSGKIKGAIPVAFFEDKLTPTPDGRYCVIPGNRYRAEPPRPWERWLDEHCPRLLNSTSTCVVVMETASWREQFRVVNCGDSGALSPDGSTLVTSEDLGMPGNSGPVILRAWDVRPTKAWGWAIAATLATALTWQFVVRPLAGKVWRRKTDLK